MSVARLLRRPRWLGWLFYFTVRYNAISCENDYHITAEGAFRASLTSKAQRNCTRNALKLEGYKVQSVTTSPQVYSNMVRCLNTEYQNELYLPIHHPPHCLYFPNSSGYFVDIYLSSLSTQRDIQSLVNIVNPFFISRMKLFTSILVVSCDSHCVTSFMRIFL